MLDSYQRNIHYLRLSLTDRCNLRCRYCAPDLLPAPTNPLSIEEIRTILIACAALGIDTIKLTGGEPLLREDLLAIVKEIRAISGIRQITLTTNGILLAEQAAALAKAGVDGVSISLDTMQDARYQQITGVSPSKLPAVLAGIEAAIDSFSFVHLNCVLQPGCDEAEVMRLVEHWKDKPVCLRFIEMMPIGNGAACHDATCLDSNALLELLIRAYGSPTVDSYHGNGPASYLQFPGFTGKIGWIGALHQPFCAACNRIRITSDGKLKTCLYYSSQLALRPLMQQGVSLIEPIRNAILQKPQAHHFSFAQKTDETNGMMQIGG